MLLLQKISYEMDYNLGWAVVSTKINRSKDLVNCIKNFTDVNYGPVHIKRIIENIDANYEFPTNRFKNFAYDKKDVLSRIEDEKFTFYVVDQIIYAKDIKKMLLKNYNTTFNFNEKNDKQPIVYMGIREYKRTGIAKFKPDFGIVPTTYTLRSVVWYNLTDNDIVIDKNMHQIWPTKTNQVPKAIVDFLNKTKENIR